MSAQEPYRVEPVDEEYYDQAIESQRRLFDHAVASSKPLTEFVLMISTQAALGSLAAYLVDHMIANGWSDRLALALGISVVLWVRLVGYVALAAETAITGQLYRLAKLLRIPFMGKAQGRVLKAVWATFISLIGFLVTVGASAAGYQLLKLSLDN